MKNSSGMKVHITEHLLTQNRCYMANTTIQIMGVMLHSVGCPQPDARIFLDSWNTVQKSVCVHGIIDGNTGEIYQTLPWNRKGWHCGSGHKGSGNNTHIGVELCEPACIQYISGSSFTCSDYSLAAAITKRTYESAVALFAFLCEKFALNPLAEGVVISHREGYKLGITSNHGDPEHLWEQLGTGYTMDMFRRAVANKMGLGMDDRTAFTEQEIWNKLKSKGLNDYAAAAVMGQFYAESGLRSDNLQDRYNTVLGMTDREYTDSVDNGSYTAFVHDKAGYGYAQWTYPARKQALLDFAKAQGKSIGDSDMQIDFFWQEIKEYPAVFNVLKHTDTVAEASDLLLTEYERPDDQSITMQKKRELYGRNYYEKYAKKAALPYKVSVSILDLNIRTGPGTDYTKTGETTGIGVFTIVEEKNGKGASMWGRLKSGAGWISLDYAKKI